MRMLSCALLFSSLAATACVAPDASGDTSEEAAAVTATPNASAFVLTVSSDENGIIVTKPDGTFDRCADFAQCTFAYIAGITVSVRPSKTSNTIDCLHFDHWTGACAGQGATCSLVINSDLATNAAWAITRGCVPK